MTNEDKFRWLCERFEGHRFGISLDKARKTALITLEEYQIILDLYVKCEGWDLTIRNLKQYKWENNTILAVNLLYKLVKSHDNKGKA